MAKLWATSDFVCLSTFSARMESSHLVGGRENGYVNWIFILWEDFNVAGSHITTCILFE